MKKLRLALFIGGFTVGGGQQVVYELIKKLDRDVLDVHVICYEGKAGTAIEREIEELCPVTYLDAKGKVTLSKMRRVFAALKKCKPDIVHVHLGGMVYAVPWILFKKVPLLITAHAKPSMAFPSTVLPLIKYGLRRNFIRVAAVSEENLKLLQEFLKIHDERLVCVNNGIATERFYRKQHDAFTFINVARQDENKNQAQIVRCFAAIHPKYPDSRLILVGDGPCHSMLKELVHSCGLDSVVTLPGIQSNTEDYYAVADVYVQASHREALPMSVLEAMAAGLIIVSTDVGGLRDIVTKNGFLVPDNDDTAMYNAMLCAMEVSSQTESQMRKYSRNAVSKYSSKKMAENYTAIYVRMCRCH